MPPTYPSTSLGMQVPIHPGEDQCEAGECPSPRRPLMRGQAWRASVGKGKTEVIPGDAAEDRVTGHGDCHIWGQRIYVLSPILSAASVPPGPTLAGCTSERLHLTFRDQYATYLLVKAMVPASPQDLSSDATSKGIPRGSAGASGTCSSTWPPSL